MPATGHLRSVPLANKPPSKVSISLRRSRFEFVNRSALFTDSLMECISSLISFDGAKRVYKISAAQSSSLFNGIVTRTNPASAKINGSLGRKLNFTLVEAGQDPVVIYSSIDLNSIPFELFFPGRLLMRTPFLSSLLHAPRKGPPVLRPTVVRCGAESFKLSRGRTLDIVSDVVAAIGGHQSCSKSRSDRTSHLTSELFKSGRTTDKYQAEWPFAHICDVIPDAPDLVILTYADLAEVSESVRQMFARFPDAFFMFVPGRCVKQAFQVIAKIFMKYRAGNGWPFRGPFQFVMSLQWTLQQILQVPIPVHGHK
jgi:hypothetical protein